MNVFITSPWVPREWVQAHGLVPRGIWALAALPELTPAAGVCAYAETVLRHAEADENSAFIFTTHCDQLRRSYDALSFKVLRRTFLFNLPATCGTPAAKALFQDELQRLSAWFIKIGGKAPEANGVYQLIKDSQFARRQLIEVSGKCAARQYAEAVLRFHADGSVELPLAETPFANARSVRLALVGGPFTAQFWPLLDEIERAGGTVVLNATEAGERSLGICETPNFDELTSTANLEQLSQFFLNRIADVFQRPNDRLLEWLRPRLLKRRVQAIVLWHYFGCDLWRAELQTLQETFHLPVLMLEADETSGGFGRIKTRLQAFLESLDGSTGRLA